MANINPFKGIRPTKEIADKISSPPYDVLNSDEARELSKKNKYTFLHIVKPEIDLPSEISLYDDEVYEKAKDNLNKFLEKKWLVQDHTVCFYLYRQIMGKHSQIGFVAGASIDEYENNLIKKHEHTRKIKEDDRTKHVLALNANTGPVFLTYYAKEEIDAFVENYIKNNDPENDFFSQDNIKHTFWKISEKEDIKKIKDLFKTISTLYVADGHHRSAAATRARKVYKDKNNSHTGNENYNYFLSVIFPHNQMKIMDYNRVVKDLNNNSEDEFLTKIENFFEVKKIEIENIVNFTISEANNFLMYLKNKFYLLKIKANFIEKNDPVKSLDVSILQNNLLGPILNIKNPREDKKIDFVGGIRGLSELKMLVDSGKFKVAFAFYPLSIEQLIKIADTNNVMPPKSTWFEPKLRSGLVIHKLI